MASDRAVDEQGLLALAQAAGLPLAEERAALLAPQLNDWLVAANELNDKMSAPKYLALMPVTIFTHPTVTETGE